MFKLKFDVAPFIQNITDFERQQLPFALMQALNDSMYAVHKGWGDELPRVFNRPTPLTLKAIRYIKATKQKLEAVVYFRDEAHKGTPPAAYLIAQVQGGPRQPKPFEKMLRSIGVLGRSEFAVPASGQPLDAYGNLGPGKTKAILADLGADREQYAHSNQESRRKRRVRNRKREGQGVYFASRGPSGNRGDDRPQHLRHGIYERMSRGFVGPSRGSNGQAGVRMVLAFVSEPQYKRRFDALGLAQQLFDRTFPLAFQIQFARAVYNARPKS